MAKPPLSSHYFMIHECDGPSALLWYNDRMTAAQPTEKIIGDRYVLQKELGRGGSGVVYLATDRRVLDRSVVVKILLEKYYQDEWIKTKFRQEMEALSRID